MHWMLEGSNKSHPQRQIPSPLQGTRNTGSSISPYFVDPPLLVNLRHLVLPSGFENLDSSVGLWNICLQKQEGRVFTVVLREVQPRPQRSPGTVVWASLRTSPLLVSVLNLRYVEYWQSLGPHLTQEARSQCLIVPTQNHWNHWHFPCPLACPVVCHPNLDAPNPLGPSGPVVDLLPGSCPGLWTKCQPPHPLFSGVDIRCGLRLPIP